MYLGKARLIARNMKGYMYMYLLILVNMTNDLCSFGSRRAKTECSTRAWLLTRLNTYMYLFLVTTLIAKRPVGIFSHYVYVAP